MEIKDFGIMFRATIANVNSYIGSQVEKYGIKQGQYEYFLLIYSMPGINQLEIGRLKSVGKASVTKALKILEENGFIKRMIDPDDRRNILCFITRKGESIVGELLTVKTNTEDDLFSGFNEKDKKIFHAYLSRFYQNSKSLTSGITDETEEEQDF